MRLEGLMLTVFWDEEWLVAEPSNRVAGLAMLGPGPERRLELHREQVASVEHKPASFWANGTVVVKAMDGRSYQLTYRRKAEAAFAALAGELSALAHGRTMEVEAAGTAPLAAQAPEPVSHPLRQRETEWRQATRGSQPSVEDMAATMTLEEPRHPLDEQIEVPNEQYHTKGVRRVFRDAGLPITPKGNTLSELVCVLVPEPWNPHDPNAVAVLIGGHQIGHIPADLAEDYAPRLGALAAQSTLATGVARVWAKDDGGMVRARATLLIPEADAF